MCIIPSRVSNEADDSDKKLTIVLDYTSSSEQLIRLLTEDNIEVGSIRGWVVPYDGRHFFAYEANLPFCTVPQQLVYKLNIAFFLDARQIHEQPSMLRRLLEAFELTWKNVAKGYAYKDYHVVPNIKVQNDGYLVFKGYRFLGEISLIFTEAKTTDYSTTLATYHSEVSFSVGTRKVKSTGPYHYIDEETSTDEAKAAAIKSGTDTLLAYLGRGDHTLIRGASFAFRKDEAYKHLLAADEEIGRVVLNAGVFLREVLIDSKAIVEAIKIQIERDKTPSVKFLDDLGKYTKRVVDFLLFFTHPRVNVFIECDVKKDFGFLLNQLYETFTQSGIKEIDEDPIIMDNIKRIFELMS